MLSYEFLETMPDIKKPYGKSVFDEEHRLIHKLNISNSEALKFSYPNIGKAVSARASLMKYVKNCRMSLHATQKGSCVIIFKVNKEQK